MYHCLLWSTRLQTRFVSIRGMSENAHIRLEPGSRTFRVRHGHNSWTLGHSSWPFLIREMPSPCPRGLRSPLLLTQPHSAHSYPMTVLRTPSATTRAPGRARDPYDSVQSAPCRLGAGCQAPDSQAVWSRGSCDPPRQLSGATQQPCAPSGARLNSSRRPILRLSAHGDRIWGYGTTSPARYTV